MKEAFTHNTNNLFIKILNLIVMSFTFMSKIFIMSKAKSTTKSPPKYRSAITGRYVTKKYGESHSKNVVKERDKK